MPEQMTSGGWVIAGWGFACGFVIATAIWLGMHWTYRIRTHVTVAGAAEQRINRVRDKAAIKSLRSSLATACRPVVARTALEVAAAYGSVPPVRQYPKPPVVVPEPDPRTVAVPLVEVEFVAAPAAGSHRYSWPAVDRKAPAVPAEAVLTCPAEASQVRRQTRVATVPDRGGNDKAGRHRLPKSRWLSDETRQFSSAEVLDAALGESS